MDPVERLPRAGHGGRAQPLHRAVPGHHRAQAGRGPAAGDRGEVPHARGADTRRHVHRRARRGEHLGLHQPPGRADARLHRTGADGEPGVVGRAPAPRGPRARAGGQRPQQQDRRALRHGVPDGSPRRAGGVGPRRLGRPGRRRGRPILPPGRHVRCHGAQGGRGEAGAGRAGVQVARREGPGGRVPGRRRRRQPGHLPQRARAGGARLRPGGVPGGPRVLAPVAPPRGPRARAGGERAHQQDRRALQDRVPHDPQGRPRRLDPGRGAPDPGR